MNQPIFVEILNTIFFTYGCLLFGMYMFNAFLSVLELRNYSNKNRYVNYKAMLSFQKLPTVSVIAPAYNEEKTIVENIKCLITLQYQDFEIIVVNDGSTDFTLAKMIRYFDLVKINKAYDLSLNTETVRGIYQSKNAAYKNLTIIDKENGGKADALNAGINFSNKDLFLAMDVDCIVETNAILKMVKPFIDNSQQTVIASGGVIRIANSCEIKDGKIMKVNYPSNFWAKFQVLEYFRAFTLGRMAWSRLNGLLIISGAFGLFDRKRVVNIGGYDKNSVGEDLELVVRLRRYMHEVEKQKYKIAFIPDPLCWTEVPESLSVLGRQRNRWTRGAIDTILKHKKMFLNPKYGIMGMMSLPYWVLFEWLGPIIQLAGILYLICVVYLGLLNMQIFITMLTFVLAFTVMYSLYAIFFEAYTFHKYKGRRYQSQSVFLIFMEMIVYQPLNMIFSISGHLDYYFKNDKKKWGVMTRTGFNKKENYST